MFLQFALLIYTSISISIHIYKRESFNSWRWFSANSSQTWRARGMKFGHNLHQYMWSDMGGLNLGYHPHGCPQANKGVEKCSPEALTPRVLMLLQWNFGILCYILALSKNINGIVCSLSWGQPQAQDDVRKCSPEALASRVLKLRTWILGILVSILAQWKNIMGTFLNRLQGKLQAQEGVGKCNPKALTSRVLKL